MSAIYDWSKAPKMATHAAMNEDGSAYWIFSPFPENIRSDIHTFFNGLGAWGVGPGHYMDWVRMDADCILETPTWTKSLEARP